MKSRRNFRIMLLLVLLSVGFQLLAQTDTLYYINSSFETAEDQAFWESLPTDNTIKWDVDTGGFNQPPSPVSGYLNAVFYWSNVGVNPVRLLVSDTINLSVAQQPELTFWHAQAAADFGHDELSLLLRNCNTEEWDTVVTYTDVIEEWQLARFNLEEEYLCDGFQLGFLGTANGGQGVCIDSVVLKETAVIEKFVNSIQFNNVPNQVIASGMDGVPLIRIDIEVIGNNGESLLNALEFSLDSGEASYFKTNGFRLYSTPEPVFKNQIKFTSTQIGNAVTMAADAVTFTGLNHELELGFNYIWLTADFAAGVEHTSGFSLGLEANSISCLDSLLPTIGQPDIVAGSIQEAVFYDKFVDASQWTLGGDFEITAPLGRFSSKSKDPSYAFSGTQVLGTDLSYDGMYRDSLSPAQAYHAYSDMVDLTYYNDVNIYMRRWTDFSSLDSATMTVSSNGGSSWEPIWNSKIDGRTPSSSWQELLFDEEADELLSRKDSVIFRLSIWETDALYADSRCGFNIDNFTIVGDHLDTDIGITKLWSPYDDCLGFGNDTVRITLRNYAESVSPAVIPLYYGLWGADSIVVRDTLHQSIAKDDSVVFTFSELANFPHGDIYDEFVVGIDLPGDEDPDNDTLRAELFLPDGLTPPVTMDFEYKGDVWRASEGSYWTAKEPTGAVPVQPESPIAWIQSPFGVYLNNDTSYLTSNCFDMSFVNQHIVELDYWLISEAGKDGFAVQYSTDDGASWQLVNSTSYGPAWGWYTGTVDALGHEGWSGTTDGNWATVKELLPINLSTEVKVQFRIIWAADGQNNANGVAIDNFKVYPAPVDAGISAITLPKDTCQYGYFDQMQLWVKNLGFNDMLAGDTIILGYNFESDAAVIDTFNLSTDLAPGDSAMFTVSTTFNVDAAGTYNIKAYTLIEDDPWFYGANNDTLVYSFETWLNPLTGLVDTISSRQPDTLMIEPIIDPQYSYLWGDASTTNTYDVSAAGTYYLTVTESVHGCQTYDSIFIELLFNDVGIDSIIWPQSSCELSSAEQVRVQIRNHGTDSLIVSDKIVLYYEVDGGTAVKDSVILTQPLYSGAALWFDFEDVTEDFTTPATYGIKSYTDYGGDTVAHNDTINSSITVFGYYDLNLGNDTIIEALSYAIDMEDAQLVSYDWSDGDTTGARIIDSSGVYALDVVDVNGCSSSDAIDIWFKIRDISTTGLLSPVSSCNRSGTDAVQIRIENTGTDTLQASDDIVLSYQIDVGTRISETIQVAGLLPGATYDYSFPGTVNLTTFGDYDFNVTAITAGDLRVLNDTLDTLVYTNSNPVVDLPIDENLVYYQAEMVLDAGVGLNYGYNWNNGASDERFYTATDQGTISLVVTDTVTGCFGFDSKFLNLDILDYLVTAISIDATSCAGVYEDMDVTILNNGNKLRQGADIELDFYINGVHAFAETYETGALWQPGDSRIHTTYNTIVLEGESSAEIVVDITVSGDIRPENDEQTFDISLLPSPEVDLGPDAQEVVFPHTLDAGSGETSYQWNDGSTRSTFTATQTGTYSVTVTGSNGCQTTRTVYLTDNLYISELAKEKMQVHMYPNPAEEYIHIEVDFDDYDTYILEVMTSTNGIIQSKEIEALQYRDVLQVGDLPPGIYFIRIRNEEMYHVTKMLIQ